ncbi:MAG: hypothetical protein KKF16_08105 [Euryarchaeota archaeon]|nr:hypothetical protein [Euryarchaeota archaeon]
MASYNHGHLRPFSEIFSRVLLSGDLKKGRLIQIEENPGMAFFYAPGQWSFAWLQEKLVVQLVLLFRSDCNTPY